MIRTLVAYTSEIDDLDAAVAEVESQLDLPGRLLKNAVGVIACHYEFVLSGAVKALCERLPFDVMGTITSAQAVAEDCGALLLTLMVLTSDEARFQTALTPPFQEDPAPIIAQTYARAAAPFDKKPSLILTFAPFMPQNSGDVYVQTLTEASGGVPCFGTLAVDDTADFRNCYLLMNGEAYRDRMGLILLLADCDPKFFIATVSPERVVGTPALITSSEGHVLREVNGRPLTEYLERLGLTKASETSYAMTSIPFMVDFGDGTPMVSRVFIGFTEERYGICAGAMPQGATLHLGAFDKADVLLTSARAIEAAFAQAPGASCMLAYSCVSRSMTLASDQLAELETFRRVADGRVPFMMAYSGGEICPTQVTDGRAVNRFHNNAFILCAF